MTESKVLVLDIPVLHQGYVELFRRAITNGVQELYVVGPEFFAEFGLDKEIRRLEPRLMVDLIRKAQWWFAGVFTLKKSTISRLRSRSIVTGNDYFSRRLMNKYFSGSAITYKSVFLRWDENHVHVATDVRYDRVSEDPEDIQIMKELLEEARKFSPDWWRQVGARVFALGRDISTYNTHVPEEYTSYALGDIRDLVKAGERPEISSALHAEQAIISRAAKGGICLDGASIYITAFPCPVCAKLIAYSGIRTCYFSSGSATFDGERVLKANGVELVLVKVPKESENG